MEAKELMRRLHRLRWQIVFETKNQDITDDRNYIAQQLVGLDRAIDVITKALKEPSMKTGNYRKAKIQGEP